jgi:arsenate reductase
MTDVRIWHNPRCSKSRATLALLEARGLQPQIVDYQQNPPSAAELDRILRLLDMAPRELMRRDEPEYAELDLDDDGLDRAALIAAMVAHPRLIQRPVVLANGKASIGRPPESVLAIL